MSCSLAVFSLEDVILNIDQLSCNPASTEAPSLPAEGTHSPLEQNPEKTKALLSKQSFGVSYLQEGADSLSVIHGTDPASLLPERAQPGASATAEWIPQPPERAAELQPWWNPGY